MLPIDTSGPRLPCESAGTFGRWRVAGGTADGHKAEEVLHGEEGREDPLRDVEFAAARPSIRGLDREARSPLPGLFVEHFGGFYGLAENLKRLFSVACTIS